MKRAIVAISAVALLALFAGAGVAQENVPAQPAPAPAVTATNTLPADSKAKPPPPGESGKATAAAGSSSPPAARIYLPLYGPPEVVMSPQQIEVVRAAALKRTLADHEMSVAYANEQMARHQDAIDRLKLSRDHDAWSYAHNRSAYERHAKNSVWIFVLTLLIVVLGLFLTIWQFTREQRMISAVVRPLLRRENSADEAAYRAAIELLKELRGTTSMKLGTAGIELGTQLIGLVVLAFSLGFFYLFLMHVYPIISK